MGGSIDLLQAKRSPEINHGTVRRRDRHDFYRQCHAEEERARDRDRQSEIYAQSDAVSAPLVREQRLLRP